jgi:uncharacterized protein (DUF934 family)
MRQLIRQREVVVDAWREASDDDVVPSSDVAESGAAGGHSLIIPIARWRVERQQWSASTLRLGVRMGPADRIETLEPDLARLSLVAIEFTGPSEGRGYTHARILRDRYRFTGELRAVGHVKRDQLLFMARCGFDAFELSEGADAGEALASFDDFTVAYQPASEVRYPLPRRTPT